MAASNLFCIKIKKTSVRINFLLFLLVLCINKLYAQDQSKSDALKCNLPQNLLEEIESYEPILKKLYLSATQTSYRNITMHELDIFVNKFQHRLCGTKTLEDAIDYMLDKLKSVNLENVHGEEVTVPHWERGEESVQLLKPEVKDMRMLGLGFSVGTPPEGIQAEAIVVKTFEELQQQAENIPGKIVVFNEDWVNYAVSVRYRSIGAIEAAKLGAVAVLVRSVTPFSFGFPHTGMMNYDANVTKIPAACITVEDAQLLHEMAKQGKQIEILIKMNATTYPDAKSRNVVAQITGSTKPEQVVVVSGHIDNWDVGQGAVDDGGGAFISWNALALLKRHNLVPKRTLRSILWTCEELGLIGAAEYVKQHKVDEKNLQFVMESDAGTFTPLGIQVSATDLVKCIVEKIVSLLKPYENYGIIDVAQGPDIDSWVDSGVPGGSLWSANEKYFYYHHSINDTILAEDPSNLDKGTALFASVAYVLANISVDLPRHAAKQTN